MQLGRSVKALSGKDAACCSCSSGAALSNQPPGAWPGMNLFGHVKENNCLYRHVNFYDFPTSMEMLARMSTGENWNCIMHRHAGLRPNFHQLSVASHQKSSSGCVSFPLNPPPR